jgi:hypothetical protein
VRNALVIVGGVYLALAVVAPSVGLGARQPSLSEREAITRALPALFRHAPVECIFVKINVSTKNPRYAYVAAQPLNADVKASGCLKYAHNGFYIVRKTARWRIIYEGSDPPRCSLHVPRDLTPCIKP